MDICAIFGAIWGSEETVGYDIRVIVAISDDHVYVPQYNENLQRR